MIEQLSVDEAFMDVRGVLRSSGTPEQLGRAIKKRIKDETGLTGSLGIARNKFLAKLGSDYRKPDGLTVIPESDDEVKSFLAPLPVSRIWGVGKVMNQRLAEAGIRTIADVQALPVSALIPIAGAVMAEHIHHLAFGIDHRPIVTESEAKSISAECTFDHDVSDPGHLRSSLVDLVEQVGRRLRRSGKTARTVHLKLRYDDFETITRQQTLRQPSRSDRRLIEAAAGLFARQSFERPVRLIGFGVSGFDGEESGSLQGELFAASDPGDARDARLDEAVDRIRETFGRHAVRRGGRIET